MAPVGAKTEREDLTNDGIAPVPAASTGGGMTIGELLASGTPCQPLFTLIPEKAPTLTAIIQANLNTTIIDYKLSEAVGDGYLFAPTDEAFDKALASLSVLNITSLTDIPEDDAMEILRLHVGGELPGRPDLINLDRSSIILDVAAKNVTSDGSSAGIVEDLSPGEVCPESKAFTIDSVFLPKSIRDAIAAATPPAPAPAPAPASAASSASFGAAAILAGVVALFA